MFYTDTNKMKWIKIIEKPFEGRKTKLFLVKSKEDNDILGIIKWYPAWRKYCFFPADKTVFETTCLSDLSYFLHNETKCYKKYGY